MVNWVDGVRSDRIGVGDRGLNLADGHFTTLLVEEGVPRLWPLHRERLVQACARLLMAEPHWPALEATLAEACAAGGGRGAVKVLLTRGEQGRGYAAATFQPPRVIVSRHPFPEHYLDWQKQGIRLGLASLRLGNVPATAGLKTLARTEQVLHRAEVDAGDYDELLALDIGGRVLEASAANLFLIFGNTLVTPSLHRGGVAGVVRQQLLRLAPTLGWHLQVRDVTLEELAAAEGAFLCNSLMQVVPVVELCGRPLAISLPLRQLQEAIAQ